jgi:hypothetical protein
MGRHGNPKRGPAFRIEFAWSERRRSRFVPLAISAILIVSAMLGKTAMATESTTTISHAQNLVENHLVRHFMLPRNELEIRYLAALSRDFPEGAFQFVATLRGTVDNNFNYLVFDGRVYCGRIIDEFKNFLKDYRYFEKLNMTVNQMVSLYVLLGSTKHLLILDSEDLMEVPRYKAFPQARPPELKQDKTGITLTFYARGLDDLGGAPALWTVTVSPDYRVEVHGDAPLKPR